MSKIVLSLAAACFAMMLAMPVHAKSGINAHEADSVNQNTDLSSQRHWRGGRHWGYRRAYWGGPRYRYWGPRYRAWGPRYAYWGPRRAWWGPRYYARPRVAYWGAPYYWRPRPVYWGPRYYWGGPFISVGFGPRWWW